MDEVPTRLRLDAPAKLNLSLRVVGKRRDGFHELTGVMVLLELADELLLTPGDGELRVEPAGSGAPLDKASNLAWRGLAAAFGDSPRGLSLGLTKRVPVAAGLGGGSSDAAAAWRLGRRHMGALERPGDAEFTELAGIGADVPFFAAQLSSARVGGIGDRVVPVQLPAGPGTEILLALAPFPLPTAAVFAELREADWGRASSSGNDLLAPARRLRPELDEMIRLAVAAGVEPRLTGSGPTLFAILDDPERADAVAGRLRRGGVSVLRTRLRAEPASIESVPTSTEEQG